MTRKLRQQVHRAAMGAVAALVATLALAPVEASAAANRARTIAGATAAMSDQRHSMIDDMSEAELQGAGCILSGTAGMVVAYGVGANEVVMVVAGGVLTPSTPLIMGVVMLSTIFTSGCAVGAIAAPFLHWGYREYLGWTSDDTEVPVGAAEPPAAPAPSAAAPDGRPRAGL